MAEKSPIDPKQLTDADLGAAVESAIREFLEKEGGAADAKSIGVDDELWTQFDSLMMMELVIHLEERFGVEMKGDTLKPDDLKTIRRICEVAVKVVRGQSTG